MVAATAPRALALPYAGAREHLADELALVHTIVERQIRAHWELGFLPRIKDDFSGKFVSGGEVAALLAGGHAPTSEGLQVVTALDRTARARHEEIEARLAATRAEGRLLPFDRLRRAFDLSATEQRVLWTLIALDVSRSVRTLVKYLVNDATRSHADAALLELLVYSAPSAREALVPELSAEGPLIRRGLVQVGARKGGEDAPWMLRPLRAARRLTELMHGVVALDPDLEGCARLIAERPAADEVGARPELVERARAVLASGALLMVTGREGAGRRTLVARAAAASGRATLVVQASDLPADADEMTRVLRALCREATLWHAVLVLAGADSLLSSEGHDAGARRAARLTRVLDEATVPVAAICGPGAGGRLAVARPVVRLEVPVPDRAVREALWRRELGDQPGLDLARVAESYAVTARTIARVAAAARDGADGPVTGRDIRGHLRLALDEKIASLGDRVTWRQTWDDVVLPEDTMLGVKELVARVKHRRKVHDGWGFSRKMAKGLGLSALFVGPPGTGKTMVAGLIADELELDLYQIDLSRIVSKYIGETQKNLGEVFDAAEAGHAILLFDEADSLFSRRGEVKGSNDRYANMEVNYLLQRIERFAGISFLTSNLETAIDPAFMRRLTLKLDFPMPDERERERLWRALLPAEAEVAPGLDFAGLARRYTMSGGHIRNAVLRAAFLAADESSAIGMSHLARAANVEYAAMRKVV